MELPPRSLRAISDEVVVTRTHGRDQMGGVDTVVALTRIHAATLWRVWNGNPRRVDHGHVHLGSRVSREEERGANRRVRRDGAVDRHENTARTEGRGCRCKRGLLLAARQRVI